MKHLIGRFFWSWENRQFFGVTRGPGGLFSSGESRYYERAFIPGLFRLVAQWRVEGISLPNQSS